VSATKRCKKCKRELSLDKFNKRNRSADGLQAYCRECQLAYKPKRRLIEKICEHCGLTFETKPTKNWDRQRFCNHDCQQLAYKPKRDLVEKNRPYRDQRESHLKRLYGLTLEDYESELHNQNHGCAICCQPETYMSKGKIIRLAIDHDHKTGCYRGLLCGRCNKGIGLFQDNIAILKQAIQYLEKFEYLEKYGVTQ
jgi:hypothetical protein